MALARVSVTELPDLIKFLLQDSGAGQKWFRGQGCHHRPLRASLVRHVDPFDAKKVLDTERRLLTRFRQRSLPLWPEGYPQNDWEHMFAMQHFKVPTRLLDWSTNALIGAYFAADHKVDQCECGTGQCRPTLWVLDPVQLNRRNSRFDGYGEAIGILATSDKELESWGTDVELVRFSPWPVALYGTHNSPRIVAQQGTFTVSGKESSALEEVPAVINYDGTLIKIELEVSHSYLTSALKILGISRAAVFPDLENLSLDIADEEIPS